MEKATRRGNYESGSDYVLEYGELRFSFNEQDFGQRVEQAAVKLDFVDGGLEGEELHDLLELAVNGEIREPTSPLGEHINEHWTELVGPANRSLVHWIRRLVFRGAWLDQRVKEGELDVVFDDDSHTFGYVQPDRDAEPIELSREPSWAGARLPPLASAGPRAARRSVGALDPLAQQRGGLARVEVGEQRAQLARRLELVRLAQLILVRDPALAGASAGTTPAAASSGSRTISELSVVVTARSASPSSLAVGERGRDHGQRAAAGEVAPGAEQALDLVDVAGGEREPRERVADEDHVGAATRRAGGRARAPARRSAPARPGAMSAVAIANSATGSASRHAVASSGRSSISSTITFAVSRGGGGAGERAQQRRPARARGGADQHPLAEGERGEQVDRADEHVVGRRRRARSAARAAPAAASSNSGRASVCGSSPLTVSTWTSARWRSPRRGSRAGPATSSPGRSSQRRTWAAEM